MSPAALEHAESPRRSENSSLANSTGRGGVAPRFLVVGSSAARSAGLGSALARLGGQISFLGWEEIDTPLADRRPPHVIILDLINCEADVAGVWDTIKAAPGLNDAPVLALVGEDKLDAVRLLDGLDDFIVAPYGAAELAERLRRILARASGTLSAQAITFGDLILDPESYEVRLSGARVDLTLKEYELLRHLLTNPGRVFTRSQLLNGIWGYEYLGGTRTVDVHVRRLRAKLGDSGQRWIHTVRGVGYTFRPGESEM